MFRFRRLFRSNNTTPENMKRALADVDYFSSGNPGPADAPSLASETNDNLEAMRKFLHSSYCLSRTVDGAFMGELCWHITKIGGQGVQDLAVNPKHASKHGNRLIKHILARDFPDPDLVDVATPTWNKKTCERDSSSIPIQLPSSIYASQLEHTNTDSQAVEEPSELSAKYTCRAWLEHPVKAASSCHWSRVLPCSLYWDSTQYTIRDNFFGLFIRCLRSGNQELVFIVR